MSESFILAAPARVIDVDGIASGFCWSAEGLWVLDSEFYGGPFATQQISPTLVYTDASAELAMGAPINGRCRWTGGGYSVFYSPIEGWVLMAGVPREPQYWTDSYYAPDSNRGDGGLKLGTGTLDVIFSDPTAGESTATGTKFGAWKNASETHATGLRLKWPRWALAWADLSRGVFDGPGTAADGESGAIKLGRATWEFDGEEELFQLQEDLSISGWTEDDQTGQGGYERPGDGGVWVVADFVAGEDASATLYVEADGIWSSSGSPVAVSWVGYAPEPDTATSHFAEVAQWR